MSRSIMATAPLSVNIRWLIRADMPEVLAIEQESFEFPWREADFMNCLRQRNCIAMVAEWIDGKTKWDRVAGFVIYELHKTRLHVLNLAVAGDLRRRGVGRALVEKLQGKLNAAHRTKLQLEVRERNKDAQLFFRAHGFRAVKTLRNYYEDSDEDAYVFEYDVRRPFNVAGSQKFNRPDEFKRGTIR